MHRVEVWIGFVGVHADSFLHGVASPFHSVVTESRCVIIGRYYENEANPIQRGTRRGLRKPLQGCTRESNSKRISPDDQDENRFV